MKTGETDPIDNPNANGDWVTSARLARAILELDKEMVWSWTR